MMQTTGYFSNVLTSYKPWENQKKQYDTRHAVTHRMYVFETLLKINTYDFPKQH